MLLKYLDDDSSSNRQALFSDKIHPTALISPGANIAPSVSIGAYSTIGPNVEIDEGTTIASHVTIEGWTRIGKNNQIGIGSIIGGLPQDLKFSGEVSYVVMGDENVIREYVTINRGTAGGGGVTSIGHRNTLLTALHVGHDVVIGNHNIIANAVAIGGHVIIDDYVTVGALCGLHQFVKLGSLSMIGALSLITKDVPPYTLVTGNPAKRYGINIERLRRNGYSSEARQNIKRAYNILFQEGLSTTEALSRLQAGFPDNADIDSIISFIHHSTRGFYR